MGRDTYCRRRAGGTARAQRLMVTRVPETRVGVGRRRPPVSHHYSALTLQHPSCQRGSPMDLCTAFWGQGTGAAAEWPSDPGNATPSPRHERTAIGTRRAERLPPSLGPFPVILHPTPSSIDPWVAVQTEAFHPPHISHSSCAPPTVDLTRYGDHGGAGPQRDEPDRKTDRRPRTRGLPRRRRAFRR
nr:hypothetical protein CFP56_16654 [Quercus suber]